MCGTSHGFTIQSKSVFTASDEKHHDNTTTMCPEILSRPASMAQCLNNETQAGFKKCLVAQAAASDKKVTCDATCSQKS